MGLLRDFKTFLMRGNVVDLAVAVAVGATFIAIVNALVADLITPIGAAIGGKNDFASLTFSINGSEFRYGDFLNAIISFVTVAATVFSSYWCRTTLSSPHAQGAAAGSDDAQVPGCLSEIPIGANRCAFCDRLAVTQWRWARPGFGTFGLDTSSLTPRLGCRGTLLIMRRMQKTQLPLTKVLPVTAQVTDAGHLSVGGCDLVDLAREWGTPLYVFDDETLRSQCRAFLQAFRSRHPDTSIAYAAKAYLGRAIAGIFMQEGLELDVVSGGELAIARSVGFPPERIHFHGNNKSEEELAEALDYGISRVIIDNFHEIALLNGLAQARGIRQKALLRLSPGIDPHTHAHTTTGTVDNKFGVPLATGQGEAAICQILDMPAIELAGLHVHLGSPVFELEPYAAAVDVVIEFAAKMQKAYRFELREFSPGGGFAVTYVPEQQAPSPDDYAEVIVPGLRAGLREARTAHAQALRRTGPVNGRPRRCRAVHSRLVERRAGCAALRLRGRRHGGQHPPRALWLGVQRARRQPRHG